MYRGKSALGLLEIVIALVILALSAIPVFTLLTRQTVDTEQSAAEAFAVNKASDVLTALLDNVPFATLRQGNPAYIATSHLPDLPKYADYRSSGGHSDWAKKMSKVLFNHDDVEGPGFKCRGIFEDAKGMSFLVHVRVEDVKAAKKANRKPELMKIGTAYPGGAPTDFSKSDEMTFSYLKNPSMLLSSKWFPDYLERPEPSAGRPLTEMDLPGQIAMPPNNVYLDEDMNAMCGSGPNVDSFLDPTAARYTAMQVLPEKTVPNMGESVMKIITVQVQWNASAAGKSNPEHQSPELSRVHLIALKADLD